MRPQSDGAQGHGRRRRLAVVAICAGLALAADQVTKSVAVATLKHGPVHVVGPFSFQLEYNSGVAFSIGVGLTLPIVLIAVVVVGALVLFARNVPSFPAALALGLVLGGALGNLSDRVLRGHGGAVVDFVHSTFWPTFNVADSCIVCGGILLGVVFVFGDRQTGVTAGPAPSESEAPPRGDPSGLSGGVAEP